MLEGFKKFAKNKNDVMLIMLSSGSLENETRRFISEYPLDSKIRLIRSVPNSELPRFLNAADVYISTSLSDGTSLSLLEAMASGLGLVVTGLPAINEWVNEENGFTVPPLNVDQVVSSLEIYYKNRKLIESHGNKNILIAHERADWDKNYLKLKKIYENLLISY
jgi:glycosyltransferase involved in cell wall biosynthesis